MFNCQNVVWNINLQILFVVFWLNLMVRKVFNSQKVPSAVKYEEYKDLQTHLRIFCSNKIWWCEKELSICRLCSVVKMLFVVWNMNLQIFFKINICRGQIWADMKIFSLQKVPLAVKYEKYKDVQLRLQILYCQNVTVLKGFSCQKDSWVLKIKKYINIQLFEVRNINSQIFFLINICRDKM